jgi:hypothetical protein
MGEQQPIVDARAVLCDGDASGVSGVETAVPRVDLLQDAHAASLFCGVGGTGM